MKKTASKKKIYYSKLSSIRLISCLAVLFYHLNILKGGYLAVCTFLVLTGYLAVTSAHQNKNFSVLEYYKNRFKKVYIPLLIVVFSTVAVISLFKNIYWITLKNETTSVILGYNNFWQIYANLDYFARHVDSPFMHFWYIAILLQFELIFPIFYLLLKKLANKVNKKLPCIITMLLSISSMIYFYILSKDSNIMNAYYNTFARSYALFLGLSLGFYKSYYNTLVPNFLKHKKLINLIYYIYLILLIISFIFISSDSLYFAIIMIIITIISTRLIDYATFDKTTKLSIKDKHIKKIVSISYEIYLIQYPVIYLFQYLKLSNIIKLPLILLIIIILSYMLHDITNKGGKMRKLRPVVKVIIIATCAFGVYKYVDNKNEQELKKLKEELAENEKIMLEKQKEYELLETQEETSWQEKLNELEDTSNYEQMVKELPITFIGDSVMLGAMNNIKTMFPNSYFDAAVSRQIKKGYEILEELKEKNILGNPVVIHLGTNGDCGTKCKENVMDLLTDKQVFWINTTNITKVNDSLNSLKEKYSNLHIIDWYSLSRGHSDWFGSDGIHLPAKGRKEYTNIIFNSLLDVYKDIYEKEKEEIIKAHQEELKKKPTFYGGELLLYNFDELKTTFSDAKLIVNKDITYNYIKESIESYIIDGTLSNKIVFVFSKDDNISTKEYKELIEQCQDSQIYLVSTYKSLDNLSSNDNVTIIDFHSKIEKNSNYLLKDKTHLSDTGNKALLDLINKYIK